MNKNAKLKKRIKLKTNNECYDQIEY